MKWKKEPGTPGVQAPISHGGKTHDYVISHRTDQHTVSYRPPGKHEHVGTFTTEKAAKAAAVAHSKGSARSHARKKSPAQLDREIADTLAKKPADQWTVHDRLAVMTPAQKKRELKDLQQARERYFRSLGYAGNTPDQARKYHDAIAEIEAKMKLFK